MVQIMGIKLPIPRQLLTRAMGMDMMNRSMHMGREALSQLIHRPAINQAMGHSSNMASSHRMACHHRVHLLNHMPLLGLVNQEMYLIKVPCNQVNRMVNRHNSSIHMHQVGPCSKHILLMGLDQLPMGIIRHHLHLAKAILSKVASLLQHTDSLVDKQQLAMVKFPPGRMQDIHLHKDILSSKLRTMQVMAIKYPKILLMVAPLHSVHQPASRLMLNQLQLNQLMTSQSHNRLLMELLL